MVKFLFSIATAFSIIALVNGAPRTYQTQNKFVFDTDPEYSVISCDNYLYGPNAAWSCHNNTVIPEYDSCCFENWGVLMSTQFWDFNQTLLDVVNSNDSALIKQVDEYYQSTKYAIGDPRQTFTIHGLWNDLCDGSYNQYCNSSLEISDATDNITHVIVDTFNEPELFDTMIKYWVNNVISNVPNGGSISLWEHEYNKHGTCMNTLLPECFSGDYTQFENTIQFYKKVVEIWKTYPTYQFLLSEGIIPTVSEQYALSDVQKVLADNNDGRQVYVGCINGTIDEIWYYNNLKGNVLTGEYRPIDTLTNSTCPDKVWYLPQ
ncbi:ribonuclease T2 precursor [Scheffersomyces coipomensis]|uniref:ribonuclease T2 precursor n=1 Tax=Scheffersomyces coipomensis TaxID=1788519 RepID=UPI00315DC87A